MQQPQGVNPQLSVPIPISIFISILFLFLSAFPALFANLQNDKNDFQILWSVCVFIFYLCNSRSISKGFTFSHTLRWCFNSSWIYILICLALRSFFFGFFFFCYIPLIAAVPKFWQFSPCFWHQVLNNVIDLDDFKWISIPRQCINNLA